MIRLAYARIKLFFKTIWNGLAGISLEISLSIIFIAAGFIVCLLWWSVFK